jgi:pimeloyl-ACP methyl ester carboxylesterase
VYLALALALVATGCMTAPVQVKRADPRAVHREITENVLTTGDLSGRTKQFLERHALGEAFRQQPAPTIAAIHRDLQPTGDHRRLSSLAELSFFHATRTKDRRHYFMAAAYAYALLFPGAGEEVLDPSDPRVRLSYDLYNRGLTEALSGQQGEVMLRSASYPVPIGTVDVVLADDELLWAGHRLDDLVAAADLDVRGIRNRYRRPGIGAPLTAALGPEEGPDATPTERFIPGVRVPVTVVMRIERPRQALLEGRLRAHMELYSPDQELVTSIDGRDVPVEFETTSSLASSLATSPLWDFELKGFLSGTFRPISQAVQGAVQGTSVVEKESKEEGLLFLNPYRRGHIPVVLVHGTASSPGRWADLVNEIENDRLLWSRYQVWLFLYNTGNPIGYSGGLLRRALESAVADLDSDGTDPALRRMVVIGHSQGGLLTKLTAIDGGDRFWRLVSDEPLDSFDLDPDVREMLQRSTYFTPEPFVGRVIFVCTPHHGSYLASMSLLSWNPARWVSGLIALPSNLTQAMAQLVTRNQDKVLMRNMVRLPTSLDNMTPGNPFIKTLVEIPIAPRIPAHSIVAVQGTGPIEKGSDGVVRYESAHIPGVESELVVRSSHSAQGQPQTIEEIRRILLEHLGEQPSATAPMTEPATVTPPH